MYPPQNPPPFPPQNPNQYQPPYQPPPPPPPPPYPPQAYPPQPYPPQQYQQPYPPQPYPQPYAAQAPAAPTNRFVSRPDTIAAAVAVGAFFLPWFGAGPMSLTGAQLGDMARMASSLAGGEATLSMILLYAIPVSAAIAFIANLVAAKRPRWASILSALIIAGTFIYMQVDASKSKQNLFDIATVGYYATIGSAAGMILLAFVGEK